MTKLESINAALAAVATAQADLQLATFALRDAQLLPEDPIERLWTISIQGNRNAACEHDASGNPLPSPFSLDGGGSLGSALARNGWPGVIEDGNINTAQCLSVEPPQALSVIYTGNQNPDTGEWSYEPAVKIEWQEV